MSARSGLVGKKSSWAHLGPPGPIFCVGRKNPKNIKILSILPWWTHPCYLTLCTQRSSTGKYVERSPCFDQGLIFDLLPHLGWIAARAPNRVNRAHGPTKENRQNFRIFSIFPAHAKNGPRWPQLGPGRFFPTNPDLADILGNTDFDFENFHFLIFWIPNFWISRSPDFQNLARARLGPGQAGLEPSGGFSIVNICV